MADTALSKASRQELEGPSNRGVVDNIARFSLELYDTCGKSNMVVTKGVRKRIHNPAEARRETVSYLCVIQIGWCLGCYIPNVSHANSRRARRSGRSRAHTCW